MDLLMTSGAVLEARAAQIMQRRWHSANGAIRRGLRPRQVGMALQADDAYFLTHQHPGIRRPMRLVAGRAAFKAHRSLLEGERPVDVAARSMPRGGASFSEKSSNKIARLSNLVVPNGQ